MIQSLNQSRVRHSKPAQPNALNFKSQTKVTTVYPLRPYTHTTPSTPTKTHLHPHLLRRDNAILLNLALVRIAHRGDKLEGRGRRNSRKAFDDVVLVGNLVHKSSVTAFPLRAWSKYTHLALCLANGLLGALDNVVRRLVRPADDDRALGSDSHGEGGEESDHEGEECVTHLGGL